MKPSGRMLPHAGKIDRSLDPGPTGRSSTGARRMSFRAVALLFACSLVVVVIVSGAVVKLPTVEETTDAEIPVDACAMPPPSYFMWGYTKDSVGDPLGECSVTVTNVRLGESRTVVSEVDGRYMYDLANMKTELDEYYEDGDEIIVEAVKDTLLGSAVGYVDLSGQNTQVDVTMGTVIPEFPMVIMPIVGMLALFAIARRRRAAGT